MLRVVIIGVLMCFSMQVLAQDAYDRYTNFFSVEAAAIASFGGLAAQPSFAIYRGGHKIDIGLAVKAYDIWDDGPGILGSYLSYKYYPNLRDRDFNLYFAFHDILSVHDKGKKYERVFDNSVDGFSSPDKVYLLENLIGIGFDLQMGNRMYFFNDYSVGAALDWETFHDAETQFEVKSTGLIRLGFGFNLGSRKAR